MIDENSSNLRNFDGHTKNWPNRKQKPASYTHFIFLLAVWFPLLTLISEESHMKTWSAVCAQNKSTRVEVKWGVYKQVASYQWKSHFSACFRKNSRVERNEKSMFTVESLKFKELNLHQSFWYLSTCYFVVYHLMVTKIRTK
jgi:hypothetical protein